MTKVMQLANGKTEPKNQDPWQNSRSSCFLPSITSLFLSEEREKEKTVGREREKDRE